MKRIISQNWYVCWEGLYHSSLPRFSQGSLPSLKELLQTVLSGPFQLRKGLVSPDRPTDLSHSPLPRAIRYSSNFKRNTQSPISCSNGCPVMLPFLSLLISFPQRLFGELRQGLGAALLIPSILSSTEIYITDERKEAVENKTSGTRPCSVTILGIKILPGFWLLNDAAQWGFAERGADWQGNKNDPSGEWALKFEVPNSIG